MLSDPTVDELHLRSLWFVPRWPMHGAIAHLLARYLDPKDLGRVLLLQSKLLRRCAGRMHRSQTNAITLEAQESTPTKIGEGRI